MSFEQLLEEIDLEFEDSELELNSAEELTEENSEDIPTEEQEIVPAVEENSEETSTTDEDQEFEELMGELFGSL